MTSENEVAEEEGDVTREGEMAVGSASPRTPFLGFLPSREPLGKFRQCGGTHDFRGPTAFTHRAGSL